MKSITKTELLEYAKNIYGIKRITNSKIQNYISIGLIERLDFDHPEGVRGSVSYFQNNSPGIFYLIEELLNMKFKLKEIKKYRDMIYVFDPWELSRYLTNPPLARMFKDIKYNKYKNSASRLEKEKFKMVLKYYACAELGQKYVDNFYSLEIDDKYIFVSICPPEIKDNMIVAVKVELKEMKVPVINYPGEPKIIGKITYSKKGVEIEN